MYFCHSMWPTIKEQLKLPALTFLLAIVVLFYFYHEVLLHPNDLLFASGGDGLKNYYTFLFQAEHGQSFWEFQGMNYPYFENVVFTDGHPFLAALIRFLGLADYGIGILNYLMLFSYPVAAVFLFLIFKHYNIKPAVGVFAAIVIAFLSPQVFRLTGHLSLSYVFVIPAMWYILIKSNNASRPFLWALIGFLFVFVLMFTHPYLGIIASFLCIFFWILTFISNKGNYKNALGFTFSHVILPFFLFRWLIFLNDHHYNRMDTPAGFFNYHAGWGSMFIPHHGPTSVVTKSIGMRANNWETWGYIGFATILFLLFIIGYTINQRKELNFKLLARHELTLFAISAYIVLVFSFCFPFKYEWMQWSTDYIGPLKQFRVLGRFTWVPYYVFTVVAVVVMYRIYIRQNKSLIVGAFLMIGIGYNFLEAYGAHQFVSKQLVLQENVFKTEYVDEQTTEVIQHLSEENYDAFIMMPFTHMSSENMMLLGEEKASYQAFIIGFHTGIPMLNSVSSRLSQEESIKFNNFWGPEYCEKELLDDIDTTAKIAVIWNDEPLSIDELRMTYTQDVNFENEQYKIATFDRSRWNTDFYYQEVLKQKKLASHPTPFNHKATNSQGWCYYESWDTKKGESLKGKGALKDIKEHYHTLLEMSADSLSSGSYEISFWYNYKIDRADIPSFVELTFKDGRDAEWADYFDIKQSSHIVGHYMQVKMNFEVTENTEMVKLVLSGNNTKEPYIVDELFVRKLDGTNYFDQGKIGGDEYIIFNNDWIKANSFSK